MISRIFRLAPASMRKLKVGAKLREVYEFLQEDEYSDEFKQMLDKEYEDYERTGEAVSKEEVDKIIQAILSKK